MKCNLGTIIVTLAAIGLLMSPALGAQGEKGGCKAHNGAMWMMNNLTVQELNNMTLGEVRALCPPLIASRALAGDVERLAARFTQRAFGDAVMTPE